MLFVHEKELIEESLDVQRRGDYLGKTVQVIPHVTDAIQDWVEKVAHQPVDESGKAPEVCIIEVSSLVQFLRMKTGKLSMNCVSSSEELLEISNRHLSLKLCDNFNSE